MKVGVFLDEYVPQDGGAHTFQNEVFDLLIPLAVESQHEFVVISSHAKEIALKLVGTPLRLLPLQRTGLQEKAVAFLARNWPNFRKLIRWSSSFEKHARKEGIEFLWFLGPRPKEIDLPYMTIVYDLEHRMEPWFPELSRWGMWDIRERGFARHLARAYAIITGTEAGKAQIEKFYRIQSERIHILPHPTPSFVLEADGTESAELPKELGLKEGYLFYPAQFWAHKNHVNLLLALKELKDRHDLSIPLVLVGSDFGNQAYVEEQVRELGLEEQVHILGFVEQSELSALYKNALALVYVTFFGPENLPPLEAMALGTPVIASTVIGAEEQLGEAALLVEPTDPQDIAKAIKKLSTDKGLQKKLIARGRKRAAQWTVEDFVRGAFKILDDFEPIRRVWRD
jgi:glycosyltransferase involved in cell wall biosynthesis